MGLGNSTGGNVKFVKIVKENKDDVNSARNFHLVSKQGDKYVADAVGNNFLEGQLIHIEFGSYEYQGEQKSTMALFFMDGADTYKLGMGFSNMSRSMLNTFAGGGEKNMNGIYKLSLYVNNKGFPSCFVELNGEKAAWKYQPGDFAVPKKVQVGAKEFTDDTACNEWFKKMAEGKIIPTLVGLPKKEEPTKEEQSVASSNVQSPTPNIPVPNQPLEEIKPAAEEESDDLPFN